LKKLILLLLIIASALFVNFTDKPVTDIKVVVNDETVPLDAPVQIVEGQVLAPAESIFKALGAEIEWNPDEKTISGIMGDFRVDLTSGSKEIIIDGETENLDFPVKYLAGKIYTLPDAPAEALGTFVNVEPDSDLIKITTPAEFDPKDPGDPEGPILNVAYPPSPETYHYADSIYVFGTTDSYSQVKVTVNGDPVDSYDPRTGNFLTMVALPRSEEYPIVVKATDQRGVTTIKRSAIFPEGWQKMPRDPLNFHTLHLAPSEYQVLSPGETLQVAFQASPGAAAYFQIGRGNWINMTEYESPGGSTGEGGIYRGTYTIREEDAPNSGTTAPMPITVYLYRDGSHSSRQMPGSVSFTSPPSYRVVEVKEQTKLGWNGWLRRINEHSPDLLSDTLGGTGYSTSVTGYLREGTRFEASGQSGNYYRVNPGGDETYLIHQSAVEPIRGKERISSNLSKISIEETADKVSLSLKTEERASIFVEENEEGAKKLSLKLNGIEIDGELEKPDFPEMIDTLEIEDSGSNPAETSFFMEFNQMISGFKYYWDNTELVIDIHKPSAVNQKQPLKNKTILIDPGHGGEDPGAPGPADYHEKDSALDMSLELKDLLLNEGANVIMTRTEDESVDLYERTKVLNQKDVDLFISVHSNAHGPGADAVDSHGLMTLYNYDHNEKLAEIMLKEMGEFMDLPEMRTWRRKIAVLRHTEVPSILVEAGYMMHPEDNWYILHPHGRRKFAEAMKKGIEAYFLKLADY